MDMPAWFRPALEAAMIEDRKTRIAALPRAKFRWGRDWGYGPTSYAFGVMWDKDPNPEEGARIYRRRFLLHITFRIHLEK